MRLFSIYPIKRPFKFVQNDDLVGGSSSAILPAGGEQATPRGGGTQPTILFKSLTTSVVCVTFVSYTIS